MHICEETLYNQLLLFKVNQKKTKMWTLDIISILFAICSRLTSGTVLQERKACTIAKQCIKSVNHQIPWIYSPKIRTADNLFLFR